MYAGINRRRYLETPGREEQLLGARNRQFGGRLIRDWSQQASRAHERMAQAMRVRRSGFDLNLVTDLLGSAHCAGDRISGNLSGEILDEHDLAILRVAVRRVFEMRREAEDINLMQEGKLQ